MLSYCLNCRKNTGSKSTKLVKTKNGRIMLLSKCAVCDSKKSRFVKEQEAWGLLSNVGIKTPLSKIPLVGLFCFMGVNKLIPRYKMNEIVNKFLLAGDKFMPEMHLRQPGFPYSACAPFAKNRQNTKI